MKSMKGGVKVLWKNVQQLKSAAGKVVHSMEGTTFTLSPENAMLYTKIDALQPQQIRMIFVNNEEMLLDPQNAKEKGEFIKKTLKSSSAIETYSPLIYNYILEKYIHCLHLEDFQKNIS